MKKIIAHPIVFLIFLFFVSSCTIQKNPVSGKNRLLAYTWTQEIQIGQEVDREITAQYGLYDDEDLAQYVTALSKNVLSESHMRRESTDRKFRETEFYFKVLDSPVVNAFALPGGYVYVTRGLMSHLNNEAQLAMVIGHEIAHVAARHASQRGVQQQLGQVAIIGGAILGQELLGLPGESIANLSSQAAQLLFLSYSRDAERESDALGVEYSAMYGYAAAEGAAFFTSLKRISEESGQSIPNLLSSHPDPGEREKRIPEMASEWREKGYEQDIYNQETYLRQIEGMIFGENPRAGYVESGSFVHPDLEFRFPIPSGWNLINQPAQVVLVSPNQDGVMILRIDSNSANAKASVDEFTAQEDVVVNSESSAQSSGQFPAYQADVTIPQDQGTLRAIIYAVEFDGNIYRFINYSEQSKFDNFVQSFQSTLSGFNRLTDERILNIRPVTLSIVEANRSGTFQSFLPDQLPMGITPEEIAIVNQVNLNDTIESGTLIKIPTQ